MTKEERYQLKMEKFESRTNEIKNHTDFLEKPGENLKKAMTLKLDPYDILKDQVFGDVEVHVSSNFFSGKQGNIPRSGEPEQASVGRPQGVHKMWLARQDLWRSSRHVPRGKGNFPSPQQKEEHEIQLW